MIKLKVYIDYTRSFMPSERDLPPACTEYAWDSIPTFHSFCTAFYRLINKIAPTYIEEVGDFLEQVGHGRSKEWRDGLIYVLEDSDFKDAWGWTDSILSFDLSYVEMESK